MRRRGHEAAPDATWGRGRMEARTDPVNNEIADVIEIDGGPGDVTVAFGSVWVATERGDLIRVER
jgi:hypothetical protein